MTKVLVTGGAGFIGSHVVDFLLEEDFSVIVLDNLSTGKKKNLSPIDGRNATLIVGDITNPDDVKAALSDVEIVCHLGAQASVAVSMSQQIFDARINVLGTLEILKQAYDQEVDQFLFTSTGGAIYGDPNQLPVSEKHAQNPVSIYGTSKLAAEKYIEFYNRSGLKTSILRLANVYGPRQDPSGEAGVISIFLGNILENKPIHVFGDGTSSRDYIYVADVATAVNTLIKSSISDPINIATGKQIFLKELIETIFSVTEKSFDVIYENERSGDVKNIYLDSGKMQQQTSWVASTNLNTGIRHVWDWIKD